jgi:hypothetical protein
MYKKWHPLRFVLSLDVGTGNLMTVNLIRTSIEDFYEVFYFKLQLR